MSDQPSQRFNQYTQIIKNNEIVGFKLDNNDFEFLFDKHGGWFDEEGKYFNADAIQCEPPQSSSDSQSQPEEKGNSKENKLSDHLLKLNVKEDDDLVEVKRELTQIVESYPGGQEIRIFVSLQPSQQNEDKLIQQYLANKINQQLSIQQDGLVIGIYEEQLAVQIIELQGTQLQHLPSKPNIYIDVELYDSLEISLPLNKKELLTRFDQLGYEKNIDYANIEEKIENGTPRSYLEIRRDIEEELWEQGFEIRDENQQIQ